MQRTIAALIIGSLLCASPLSLFAQEAPTADANAEEFKRVTSEASKAYSEGDYTRAVELFEQAYALKPVSNILYNIARIHEESGEIDAAITYYDKFVVAPNVEQNARKDALDRLKTLREVQAVQEREAKAAEEQEIAEKETPPPEPTPTKAEPESNTAATLGWVFLGVGGASLITSGIFGVLAQGSHGDFESATSLEDRRAAASAGRTQSIVADSLLVTGIVTGVIGGVVLIASSGGSETDPATATNTWSVGPLFGKKAAGLEFRLSY